MMKSSAFLCCLLVASTSILSAQEKSPAEAVKVTFEDDVKPIFRQHCFNCHNQGENKGGLAVDSYTALLEGGGSGEVVYDDGDVEGSRLWQLINHDDTPIMPPNQDKIPAEQLEVVRAWLEGGILENSGSKAKVQKNNALTYVASASGKPDGPVAMPETVPFQPEIVVDRTAAATAIGTSPWAPLVAIAGQRQITLYHTESSELLGVLPFPEGVAQSLRFSRDGSYLVAGGGEHGALGMVAIYDVKTGERAATVGDELDIVFDADTNHRLDRIALGGPQRMLRIYNVADGALLFDIKKHTDWIYTVAYSPDGVLIASGDRSGGLIVWEAETGRLYLDLAGHKGAVTKVAWRDDSNVLASAGEDGTVRLWDMEEGKTLRSINAHGSGVTDVAFDHQGRLLTAGNDKRVKLWDANGKELTSFPPMPEVVLEAEITFDGKRVIYGDWNGTFINALVENPKDQTSLHPNPPALALRSQVLEKQLKSLQAELQPLKTVLDEANKRLAAASQLAEEAKHDADQIATDIAQAEKKLASNRQSVDTIDAELPTQTLQSRSLHDQVIANRVMLEKTPARQEAVAAAELALAEQLTRLAEKRRARVAAEKAIVSITNALVQKRALAKKTQEALVAAETKLTQATAKANSAKAEFSQRQSELSKIQQELNEMRTVSK